MTLARLSDEQLIARIADREVAALDALYDRHAQVVFGLILRIVREREIAEELLQESFWQVWKSASSYRGNGAGAAWLYQIARNKALDQLRRARARPNVVDAPVEMVEAMETVGRPSTQNSPVELTVEQRWRAEQVRKGLDEIPEEQRICLELAYFEGMSQSQIAEHLGLPLGTIKTRLRLGCEKLERFFLAAGMLPDAGQNLGP